MRLRNLLQLSILDFHIGRAVVTNTLLLLLILISLFLFFVFVEQLGDLGIGNYGVPEIIAYLGLGIPGILYEIFPLAILLGTIVGLSTLAESSELIVMRAAGVSIWRVFGSCVKVGLVMSALVFVLGEWLAPDAESLRERVRADAMQTRLEAGTRSGIWLRDGNRFINIREVLPDLSLRDIRLYEFDQRNQLRSMVRAESGQIADGEASLKDTRQTVISLEARTAESREFSATKWRTRLDRRILEAFSLKPDQLSLSNLVTYISHLRANGQDTGPFQLSFWNKAFFIPLVLVMMFLAVPFVFSQTGRGQFGKNILIGIGIGIAFFVITRSFGYMVLVYGIPPIIAVLTPILVFFILGAWFARRAL